MKLLSVGASREFNLQGIQNAFPFHDSFVIYVPTLELKQAILGEAMLNGDDIADNVQILKQGDWAVNHSRVVTLLYPEGCRILRVTADRFRFESWSYNAN